MRKTKLTSVGKTRHSSNSKFLHSIFHLALSPFAVQEEKLSFPVGKMDSYGRKVSSTLLLTSPVYLLHSSPCDHCHVFAVCMSTTPCIHIKQAENRKMHPLIFSMTSIPDSFKSAPTDSPGEWHQSRWLAGLPRVLSVHAGSWEEAMAHVP